MDASPLHWPVHDIFVVVCFDLYVFSTDDIWPLFDNLISFWVQRDTQAALQVTRQSFPREPNSQYKKNCIIMTSRSQWSQFCNGGCPLQSLQMQNLARSWFLEVWLYLNKDPCSRGRDSRDRYSPPPRARESRRRPSPRRPSPRRPSPKAKSVSKSRSRREKVKWVEV